MDAMFQDNFLGLAVLAVLGAIVVLKAVLSVVSFIYVAFLRPSKNVAKLGEWAVITGATDGIGQCTAFELAKRGMNIVLVSRTAAKLQETQIQIKEKYPKVQIKMIPYDFSKATAMDLKNLQDEIVGLNIGILYNNVGMSYEHAEKLQDITDERIDSIIEINNRQMIKLTRMVLPGMVERKKGAIINIGSGEGCIPAPFYAVYGASKAFIEWFTKDLNSELKGTGVTCHAHIPLYVATKMSMPNAAKRKASFFAPWPETWAKASIAAIGHEPFTLPYWPHKLQLGALQAMPWSVQEKIRYNQSALIRKIALKKKLAAKTE